MELRDQGGGGWGGGGGGGGVVVGGGCCVGWFVCLEGVGGGGGVRWCGGRVGGFCFVGEGGGEKGGAWLFRCWVFCGFGLGFYCAGGGGGFVFVVRGVLWSNFFCLFSFVLFSGEHGVGGFGVCFLLGLFWCFFGGLFAGLWVFEVISCIC